MTNLYRIKMWQISVAPNTISPSPSPSNINITKHFFLSNPTQPCKTNSSVLRMRLAGRQKCEVSGIENEKKLQTELAAGVEGGVMPKHVAVIMDGNRRWAQNNGLPTILGHRAGGKALLQLLRNSLKYGVKVLTVFAFSTENWSRPRDEVNFLFDFFGEFIKSEIKKLSRDGVRFSFMGSRSQLPESLQKLMYEAEEFTKGNTRLHLLVGLNYGGRYDITEATKKIARKVKDGMLEVEEIDDRVVEQHLQTSGVEFSNPDLLIRSSGECRLSNFMLWQLAYTELFFTDKLFPLFGETDFVEALAAFQSRQRRFGGHKY